MKKTLLAMLSLSVIFSCADYNLLDEKPRAVTLSITDIQDSSVTLRWTQPDDENFKSYKVYYDTSDHLGRLADSTLFAQDTTQTIKNLVPATAYYFAVIMTNQAAKTSMSNIASAITWLQFRPQEWVGDSAIVLKWNRPKGVTITGYRIYSDTISSVDTLDTLEGQLTANDSSFSQVNLPFGTMKYFRVFARGSSGYLTGSTTAQVNGWWFMQYAPVQASDTSVTLSWAPVTGSVQQYRAFRSTSSPVDTNDTACGTFSASDTIGTVAGLVQGTRCFFKVYARSASGYIAWTQEESDSLQ
jgi:hypothetical protein